MTAEKGQSPILSLSLSLSFIPASVAQPSRSPPHTRRLSSRDPAADPSTIRRRTPPTSTHPLAGRIFPFEPRPKIVGFPSLPVPTEDRALLRNHSIGAVPPHLSRVAQTRVPRSRYGRPAKQGFESVWFCGD